MKCDVYGLMVTGKTSQRVRWAQSQVRLFMQQTYTGNKYMIVANEHPYLKVLDPGFKPTLNESERVMEFQVRDRHQTTLGNIRNDLLSRVPAGVYVFIVDDDDYLHPELLHRMSQYWEEEAIKSCKDYALIQIQNRLNHNVQHSASWESSYSWGCVHFMAKIDRLRDISFQYLNVETLEDLSIQKLQIGEERLIWHNNSSNLYIRYVHTNNTSAYVNPKQCIPNMFLGEKPVNETIHHYCVQHVPEGLNNGNPNMNRIFQAAFITFVIIILIFLGLRKQASVSFVV